MTAVRLPRLASLVTRSEPPPLDGAALARGRRLGQLTLHYQPVIELRSGAIAGAEALLRWHVPHRGTLAAAQFADLLAEEASTARITPDLLRMAAEFSARLPRPGGARYPVSVHVKPADLLRPHALAGVAEAIERAEHDPARIELAVSRLHAMSPEVLARILPVLREARRMGVRLALNELHEAPNPELLLQAFAFDAVQLDAHDVAAGGVARIVVARAIRAARGYPRIVAKRIETSDQLRTVRALGATHATGYLLGRPLPPLAFRSLLGAAAPAPAARPSMGPRPAAPRRQRVSA